MAKKDKEPYTKVTLRDVYDKTLAMHDDIKIIKTKVNNHSIMIRGLFLGLLTTAGWIIWLTVRR